jgi:hypothetical protein
LFELEELVNAQEPAHVAPALPARGEAGRIAGVEDGKLRGSRISPEWRLVSAISPVPAGKARPSDFVSFVLVAWEMAGRDERLRAGEGGHGH